MDVDRYLDRIGYTGPIRHDVACLEALQRAHMTVAPFENLDVFSGHPVRADVEWGLDKVVDRRRGGWCFELNGAFSVLLEALGFTVTRLGAAVLRNGPRVEITHLTLEVTLDQPYLVDVGFGDSFCRPLELNRTGPQDGGSGSFELMASAQGTTMTKHDESGVPVAEFRFSRVAREQSDFEDASQRLQTDKSLSWHQKAFATRLLDGGPDRVTLIGNSLKTTKGSETTEIEVPDDAWSETLRTWFDIEFDLRGPPSRS